MKIICDSVEFKDINCFSSNLFKRYLPDIKKFSVFIKDLTALCSYLATNFALVYTSFCAPVCALVKQGCNGLK